MRNKMKRTLGIAASCVLATGLMAGTALAKNDQEGQKATAESKVEIKAKAETKDSKSDSGVNTSVTTSTYGGEKEGQGKNGYRGLLNAIENVKDRPAGSVIADKLLSDYAMQLSAELKAELEAIVEKDQALTAAADVLANNGNVTEAVYVQKDAVRANVKNIDSYKKLGKLYEKLGKAGVQLYVNGEEPALEVRPFIKDGSTLVPFRAISEALKAEVNWNSDERSVTVSRDGITVKLFIDSAVATVDGKEVTLEVPAAIVEGNTVVPVRFVSEALKAAVKWENETQSVIIYEEK